MRENILSSTETLASSTETLIDHGGYGGISGREAARNSGIVGV